MLMMIKNESLLAPRYLLPATICQRMLIIGKVNSEPTRTSPLEANTYSLSSTQAYFWIQIFFTKNADFVSDEGHLERCSSMFHFVQTSITFSIMSAASKWIVSSRFFRPRPKPFSVLNENFRRTCHHRDYIITPHIFG